MLLEVRMDRLIPHMHNIIEVTYQISCFGVGNNHLHGNPE